MKSGHHAIVTNVRHAPFTESDFTEWAYELPPYVDVFYCDGAEQLAAARQWREAYQRALQAEGHGDITTEVEEAPSFYYAEDYHQQYLAKNPNGYCGIGGTGVACPVGIAVS